MAELLVEHCNGCIYIGKTIGLKSCDFNYITGMCRGCRIEDCEHYKDKKVIRRLKDSELQFERHLTKDERKTKALSIREQTHKRRMAYYEAGMTDVEIAEKENIAESSARLWRTNLGLPAVPGQKEFPKTSRLTPEQKAIREKIAMERKARGGKIVLSAEKREERDLLFELLYSEGLNDRQIEEKTGHHRRNVCDWRKRTNRPPNTSRGWKNK